MRGIFLTFGAAVVMICLVSCQREIGADILNGVQNDSTYISRMVIFDTTFPTGQDTVELIDISYDGSKRISRFSDISFTGGTSIRAGRRVFNYNYNSTDTVPSNVIENYSDLISPFQQVDDTAFYYYQNGLLVKDSAIEINGWYVNNYSKIGTNRYMTIKLMRGMPSSTADTCFSFLDINNGNLLTEIDSEYQFHPPVLANVESNIATYDNHPNPLRKLFIPYQVPIYPTIRFNNYLTLLFSTPSRNNLLTFNNNGTLTTGSYIYGTNGMPSVSIVSDGTMSLKAKYFYIN